MIFTEEQINALRERMSGVISSFRFGHTLGVENMAARLARIYCPEKELMLRAAALLHDITKEIKFEDHLAIFKKYGFEPIGEQLSVPPTLHALSAALIIPDEYPEFADGELIDAVRYHSTGRDGMTLSEKIIYLADYIEETRKYEDCIALREEFFASSPEKMDEKEKLSHLNRVMLHSIELTVEDLASQGKIIERGTLEAAESLKKELGENPK
jgi:nicotinate-nucleotide adenylyltransferase